LKEQQEDSSSTSSKAAIRRGLADRLSIKTSKMVEQIVSVSHVHEVTCCHPVCPFGELRLLFQRIKRLAQIHKPFSQEIEELAHKIVHSLLVQREISKNIS
jgi:hypothetical protein